MLLYNLPYSLEIYLKFSKMNCRSQAAYNISNVRSKLKEHLIRSLSTCLLLNIDAWASQDLLQLIHTRADSTGGWIIMNRSFLAATRFHEVYF